MQNNDKGLRPHFRIKIQDQNGKSFDAGGVWHKEGKYGLFLSGTFNNNVQLQPGQRFMLAIPDEKLKGNLTSYFQANPQPPKVEKKEYNNNNYNNNQNYNRGNYQNNEPKSLGNSIPNISQSWPEGRNQNAEYSNDGQVVHDQPDEEWS
jgi:hypothetical protein